jgi:hypothetical protein
MDTRAMTESPPVFEQNIAPGVAAQKARFLADWLRTCVGLVAPTGPAGYFGGGTSRQGVHDEQRSCPQVQVPEDDVRQHFRDAVKVIMRQGPLGTDFVLCAVGRMAEDILRIAENSEQDSQFASDGCLGACGREPSQDDRGVIRSAATIAIPIADVLAFYLEHRVPRHARPKETRQRIGRLADFFGDKSLEALDGELCRAFVKVRGRTLAAREDLVVLRSAINFYREEGRCDRVVSVVLPDKRPGRDRWLTCDEAARLIWSAWRYREVQKGHLTGRYSRRHVARFILVGLYTGTRASAICSAAFEPFEGHGYIDVERGIFYRRPAGAVETRKRRPPLPRYLVAF